MKRENIERSRENGVKQRESVREDRGLLSQRSLTKKLKKEKELMDRVIERRKERRVNRSGYG